MDTFYKLNKASNIFENPTPFLGYLEKQYCH